MYVQGTNSLPYSVGYNKYSFIILWPLITLESTPQDASATLNSQPADQSNKHVPVLHATSSAIDSTSVASTLLVTPIVNNNPLTLK